VGFTLLVAPHRLVMTPLLFIHLGLTCRASSAFQTLGVIYEERGQNQKALDIFLVGAHLKPKDKDMWYRLSQSALYAFAAALLLFLLFMGFWCVCGIVMNRWYVFLEVIAACQPFSAISITVSFSHLLCCVLAYHIVDASDGDGSGGGVEEWCSLCTARSKTTSRRATA
jgi:hypothetical protein